MLTWREVPSPDIKLTIEEECVILRDKAKWIVRLARPSPETVAAIQVYLASGASPSDVDLDTLCLLEYVKAAIQRTAGVHYEVLWQGKLLASVRPRSPKFIPDYAADPEGSKLSRFAYIRPDGKGFTLESPECACAIDMAPEMSLELSALCRPILLSELSELGCALAATLGCTGFLEATKEDHARATWEFHDVLFHAGSRLASRGGGFGATYRFRDAFNAPPALKPDMSTEVVSLLSECKSTDGAIRALRELLDRRISAKEMGEKAITLSSLGELLYESVRTREVINGPFQNLLKRPYPSGGSIHELEFYVVVSRCDGLDPGMYHYDGAGHQLFRLPTSEAAVAKLLDGAREAWGNGSSVPQVLLIISSRLPRLAWKYEGIAYRISLLNAGVAIETLYLAATALNLSCSALGLGDPLAFAAATGLDMFAETSIAEFAVGLRA